MLWYDPQDGREYSRFQRSQGLEKVSAYRSSCVYLARDVSVLAFGTFGTTILGNSGAVHNTKREWGKD
jgi:hypothetical protein